MKKIYTLCCVLAIMMSGSAYAQSLPSSAPGPEIDSAQTIHQDSSSQGLAGRFSNQRAWDIHAGALGAALVFLVLFFFLRKNLANLKQSEQELTTFKEALDTATDAIGMATPAGRHFYQNRSFDTLFGSVGENPPDTLYVDPEFGREIFTILMAGGQWTGEVKMYARDRSILEIFLRAYANKDTSGKIISLVGIHTDITERNRAAHALRESEAKLATLFHSMSEMVALNDLVFDEQGRVVNYRMTDCNKAFTDITGIVRETSIGRLATDVYTIDTPPYLEEFTRVALTGEPYRFETYFAPMGKHFLISVVCPAKNSFATITSDITIRKKAEEEHTRLQAQLTQAQKIESIGRLAGGVAHDFNNILSVILGYTEMALQDVGPEQPLHADLQEIRTAVNRSSNLTRQLLAFARKQTMAPQVLDLNETLEEMLKMLRRLIGEDIDLIWLPDTNIQPVKIDPSQLDQVLANLCVNARDAIVNGGRITIETGSAVLDEAYCLRNSDCVPGDYVTLIVSDDGCGMDSETLANIFDPFFTTKDIGTGTGLGLSTVYGIIKQHDGCIAVHSDPGQGTQFTIYLPKHIDVDDQAPEKEGPELSIVRGKETILLVEDEPANLEMYRRMLEALGYKVLVAAKPEECICLARENVGRIELLLTDVVMPGMNGPELAKTIQEVDPGIKCLFMSGYMDAAITKGAVLDLGSNLIQKPFSFDEFAARVRAVLEGSPDR